MDNGCFFGQCNGPTDVVKVHFNKRLTRFDTLHRGAEPTGFGGGDDSPF